jgi:NADH dehydrogenase
MSTSTQADQLNGMIVAVAGATGFVGSHIVKALLASGAKVRALVRDPAKARQQLPTIAGDKLVLIPGTLDEPTALANLCAGAHSVVNAVGIIREVGTQTFERIHVKGTQNLVTAASAAKVQHFVQISALGVRPDGIAEYQRSKWEGEQIVRRSGMAWTILRPSMIHGVGSEAIDTFLDLMSGETPPYLFIPYFQRWDLDDSLPLGPAHAIDPVIQPVHVEDVALAVVASLSREDAKGEIYNLVGSEVLAWPDMLRFIRDNAPGASENLHPFGIPAPIAAGLAFAAKFIRAGQALPYDFGMAMMGSEDSVGEIRKVRHDLGVMPRGFKDSFRVYAPQLA